MISGATGIEQYNLGWVEDCKARGECEPRTDCSKGW